MNLMIQCYIPWEGEGGYDKKLDKWELTINKTLITSFICGTG
jgi:hypothetical protein